MSRDEVEHEREDDTENRTTLSLVRDGHRHHRPTVGANNGAGVSDASGAGRPAW